MPCLTQFLTMTHWLQIGTNAICAEVSRDGRVSLQRESFRFFLAMGVGLTQAAAVERSPGYWQIREMS